MPKDKKSKAADKKARTSAKQNKKAAKGEKKSKARNAAREDSDADEEVDLDSVLAAYAQEQARYLKVTEQASEPPSPRSSSTFIASPSNSNELFLFGGEYYDGTSARFYNDLFLYLINKGEWRQVTSPNTPLPRSGHSWCRGGNTGGIYLFGGEFSSPKQGTFYHYNDFWHLDTDSREWTRLEAKSKGKTPPARSGHRMTYFKNYILLFGGFQDTSQQTKYLQDLWIYDCRANVWHESKLPPATQKPDPRSSFTFLPHETGGVVYGGYSRVKAISTAGKQGKGGPQRNILKPMIHQDTWFLRITQPADEAPSDTAPTVRWERRKKPVNSPTPPRAGATMAYHKGRGVLFGGVHDTEESEEGIDSVFFHDMFIWNVDRNRVFPVGLRRPRNTTKRVVPASRGRHRGKADEEELLRNLAALETKGSISGAADVDMELDSAGKDEPPMERKDVPVKFEMPHPRFNAQLAVQDDILYIYGGTYEKKDVEITFSDLYSLDLGKLDGVRELYYQEPTNWNITTVESEDEDEDEDDEMNEDESDDESDVDDVFSPAASVAVTEATVPPSEAEEAPATEEETSAQRDSRPFPRPFESLRDFYSRTSEDWQNLELEKLKYGSAFQNSDHSVKELRKKAFELAEERWWDCREEIRKLEDEQEAAGIGEVVSMADRGTEAGAGRRR